jgi:hypothetical protein
MDDIFLSRTAAGPGVLQESPPEKRPVNPRKIIRHETARNSVSPASGGNPSR